MNKQQRFRQLLEKRIREGCTEPEKKELLRYFKESGNAENLPTLEEAEQLLGELPILPDERIEVVFSKITGRTRSKSGTARLVWKYVSVAAMLTVFLGLGFLYRQGYFNADPNDLLIPNNEAITLELDNGNIQVIEEDGTAKVMDSRGNTIGTQQGSQLLYTKGEETINKLAYNTLTVPYGKRFDLQLSDGTQVRLNAGTSLTFPVHFLKGMERKVYLTGEAFFDVAEDAEHPFIVNSQTLNIRVLGTEFNVSGYPEDDLTDVVLVEGSVAMFEEGADFNTVDATILEPGTKGSFDRENRDITIREVAIDIYTAWIDGELVFRNMKFNNILKKLERHFHIEIENTNSELGGEPFNASFGNEPIEKVLETLRTVYGIEYSIKNNKVIIE